VSGALDRRSGVVRAAGVLLLAVALAGVLDGGRGTFFTLATGASIADFAATLGLVAVGLGLVMAVGEFDLSVGAMSGLGGVLAVGLGDGSPYLGLGAAVLAGLVVGVLQGSAVVGLGVSSTAVTLGGLLTMQGVTQVATGGSTLRFEDIDFTLALTDPVAEVLTARSLVVLLVVVALAAVLGLTRIGRDVYATGSDRRGARVAGVRTAGIVVGAFAVSGALAGLSGGLLSLSLAAASPVGLSDVLVPAIAAAILGGVSLRGGTGAPLAILLGVLALGVLQSGLTAAGQPSQVQDLYVGAVLLLVAVLSSDDLRSRLLEIRAWRRSRPPPSAVEAP